MRMSGYQTVLAGLEAELVSALPGAAKLMADGRGAWIGTYIALFQPAEEVGAGSRAMSTTAWSPKCRGPTSPSPST